MAGVSVLYVDGDEEARKRAEFVLGAREGLAIVAVETAREAVDSLDGDRFHCVVTEYNLPHSDGVILLEEVRDRRDDLPVIMFTASGSEAAASDAISAGVTEYVEKRPTQEAYLVLASRVRGTVAQHLIEARLEDRRRQQRVVSAIGRMALSTEDLGELLSAAVDRVAETLGADCAEVFEPGASGGLLLGAATGWPEPRRGQPVTDVDTHIGRALAAGSAVVVEHYRDLGSRLPPAEGMDLASGACVAIRGTHSTWGVLGVHDSDPRAFGEADRFFLKNVANVLASAIERQRSEAEGDVEEQKFRAVFEGAFDAIALLDEAGRVVRCNDAVAELFEFDRETLQGQPLSGLVADDADPRVLGRALAGERSPRGIVRMETASGDRRVVEFGLSLSVLPGRNLAVLRDVTDRERRQRRLERQRERLTAFADLVADDLQRPLSIARGFLELYRDQYDVEPDGDEHLAKVDTAHRRMERIVDEVLTLAKHEGDGASTGAVELRTAAKRAWMDVETGNADLELAGNPRIEADAGALQQLLGNLFRNSVEHGGRAVTVRVAPTPESAVAKATPERIADGGRAREDDRRVRDPSAADSSPGQPGPDAIEGGFVVEDNGPGIPEGEREDVFSHGYTTREDGTGVGLAIVDQIADAHGWTVRVTESEAGGARFEFTGVEFR